MQVYKYTKKDLKGELLYRLLLPSGKRSSIAVVLDVILFHNLSLMDKISQNLILYFFKQYLL